MACTRWRAPAPSTLSRHVSWLGVLAARLPECACARLFIKKGAHQSQVCIVMLHCSWPSATRACMQALSMQAELRMLMATSRVQVEICNLGPLPGDEVRPAGVAASALLLAMQSHAGMDMSEE